MFKDVKKDFRLHKGATKNLRTKVAFLFSMVSHTSFLLSIAWKDSFIRLEQTLWIASLFVLKLSMHLIVELGNLQK